MSSASKMKDCNQLLAETYYNNTMDTQFQHIRGESRPSPNTCYIIYVHSLTSTWKRTPRKRKLSSLRLACIHFIPHWSSEAWSSEKPTLKAVKMLGLHRTFQVTKFSKSESVLMSQGSLRFKWDLWLPYPNPTHTEHIYIFCPWLHAPPIKNSWPISFYSWEAESQRG